MTAYMVLRFVKYVGVLTFFAGLVGTFQASDAAGRRKWAERHAAPGYVMTWLCGLGLASTAGHSLAQTWIVLGAALGTVSVWAVLWQAHFMPHRRSKVLSMVASQGFLASLAAMVFKP